jgi:hypothetical protein
MMERSRALGVLKQPPKNKHICLNLIDFSYGWIQKDQRAWRINTPFFDNIVL